MARTKVQSELIATNAISGTIIADNAITATHIATNAISGTLVQSSGIVTDMIASNNVTAAKIVTDAIQTRHIADDQVTGDKLTNNITIAGTLTSTGAFTSPGIDDNADANAITIDSSEKVGIGETSPTLGLSVGDGKGVLFGPSGSSASMYISPDHENTLQGGYGIDSDDGDLWINYRGYQNGTSRFRDFRVGDGKENLLLLVDGSAGNVGIGGVSPVSKVHIQGPSASTYTGNGPSDVLRVSSSSAGAWIASDFDGMFGYMGLDDSTTAKFAAYNYATSTEGNMILGQNRMYIKNNGNVGIGTSTPQKTLHIEHTGGASEGILITGSSDTAGHTAGILLRAEAGESDSALRAKGGIFFERTGTYGVGKLHLANDTGADNNSVTISDAKFTIQANGGISLTGNHQFNFRANGASNPGNGAIIVFDAVQQGNAASCYNTSTGAYQAAIDGWYMVSVGIRYDSLSGSANEYARPQLRHLPDGGSTWQYPHQGGWVDPIWGIDFGSGDYINISYTVPMYLANGDQIQVMNNGNCTNSVNHNESHFGVIFMG